jgi:hypothetical protein
MPQLIGRTALTATAQGVRAAAEEARRDALAARWRAQGLRVRRRDLSVQCAWTVMQVGRRRDGQPGYFHPLPASVLRSLDR